MVMIHTFDWRDSDLKNFDVLSSMLVYLSGSERLKKIMQFLIVLSFCGIVSSLLVFV